MKCLIAYFYDIEEKRQDKKSETKTYPCWKLTDAETSKNVMFCPKKKKQPNTKV